MRKIKPILILIVLVAITNSNIAQSITVGGNVTSSSDGMPLSGVSVTQKGTQHGTITDANGNYRLDQVPSGGTLSFSFVGYQTMDVPVNSRLIIDVNMTILSSNLQEVVVTGYMTQKKADITGSVTTVNSDQIEKTHGTSNVLTSLQGVVPGMRLTNDGSPTASRTNVSIRGLTSVNGAPPLIVIDGVPAVGLNLRDINPGNIASIQVLRDAYSSSIYGSQGAGGVILIETKEGGKGKPTVSYTAMTGFSDWLHKPTLLNTIQYGTAQWQAAVNSGLDPNSATQIYAYEWHTDNGVPILDKVTPRADLGNGMTAANTDWIKETSHRGLQTDHQVTVSGGNDRGSSLLSLDYYKNEGFIIHTGYERFTARLNSKYKLIGDHLEVGENIEFSRLNMSAVNDQAGIHMILVEPPIIPVHAKDGNWGGSAAYLGMDDYQNPVRIFTQEKDNRNKYNKLIGGLYANVYFLKNFTLHSQLGLIYTEGNHRNIGFTFQEAGGRANTISSIDQWYWWQANQTWTNTLDYKVRMGKSALNALIGMEATKFITETTQANRQGIQFQNYDYAYLSTATGNMSVSGAGDVYRTLSYFAKVNYVFDSKYLISGSLRRDGSSKFGSRNRYGNFPAISIGWRMTEEGFMKENKFFSELKPRISWGKNGNSNIPSGATVSLLKSDYNFTSYAIAGNETGNNPSGYYKTSTGNEFLKWESSEQINFGIDFGLLSQRLTGSIDFYRKNTSGMLFRPPYLGTIGEGGYKWVNAADMSDQGIEFQVTYASNFNSKFHWTITANLSHNKNAITNLPANVQFAYGGSRFKGDDIQGHAFHSYYGFITDGIFKTQEEVDKHATQPGKGLGRLQYRDISGPDGTPDGKVDFDYDQTWIGKFDPDIEYGIAFNANYKNFDFYMLWQGVAGLSVFDQTKTYSDFWNVWVQNGFNHPVRILDAWSPVNPTSDIPALSIVDNNNELRMSTYLLSSGSYLKLRNIQLGYRFNGGFMQKIGAQRFRIYVMSENLVILKKSKGRNAYVGPDPETANVGNVNENYANPYVIPTNYKLGLEINF